MAPDDPLRKIPPEPDPADEIEILEVVGLDEGGAPVGEDRDAEGGTGHDVEVVFEDGSAEAPPAAPLDREEVSSRERILRMQADFENFKKRIDRERLSHLRHATGDLVARLLPVLDNFERAVASARSGNSDAVADGILLIHRQLLEELKKEGLRPMDSIGEPFDPTLHEAVATDPEGSGPPNTVTMVFQRGYYFHDRVLRPALVRVSVDHSGKAATGDGAKES